MATTLLELAGVWAARGRTVALRDVSLSVPRGARLGVFGPGGSGKTTLLKLLAGLYHPSRGELRWSPPPPPGGLGMVFQRDALLDSLSALENVALPLAGRPRAEIVAREALARVGLGEDAGAKRPIELSGGMRKRTGLARVLAANPPVKLFDEPTAGLDPATEREILDVLDRAHDASGLTVTASANPEPFFPRCDLALVLSAGEPIAFGEAAEVARRGDVRRLFGAE